MVAAPCSDFRSPAVFQVGSSKPRTGFGLSLLTEVFFTSLCCCLVFIHVCIFPHCKHITDDTPPSLNLDLDLLQGPASLLATLQGTSHCLKELQLSNRYKRVWQPHSRGDVHQKGGESHMGQAAGSVYHRRTQKSVSLSPSVSSLMVLEC